MLRVKGRFFKYSIINVHCPHKGSPDDKKDAFYAQLEQTYCGCSTRDVKIVVGDINAQVGSEEMHGSVNWAKQPARRIITASDA